MTSQITPTGMVTYSQTNPLDQIPVGPQVFPFGTPTVEQSQVEPYLASNYAANSAQIEAPDVAYQSIGNAANMTQVQTVESLPAANYDASALAQYQVMDTLPAVDQTALVSEALPAVDYGATALASDAAVNYDASALAQYQVAEALPMAEGAAYDAGAYQTAAQYTQGYTTGYQYRTVLKPVVKTSYQAVVKYKPVTKIGYEPRITTKYVPVAKPVVNQGVSTIGTVPQQSLALSQTTPLASSLQSSTLATQPMAIPTTPMPVGGDNHFVYNYPIYENDPRRNLI